ncbi:hypothetical protein MDA_GLEAN10011081 [Myotis davidii]|uniref:Uncharacterized protein n=1 Tax=Myotis davidii TaxID=225400 RepID=L5M6Q4_MYODS|nr:hypothetical protein MDA_GLEAN10011081 [Myotis davidii]
MAQETENQDPIGTILIQVGTGPLLARPGPAQLTHCPASPAAQIHSHPPTESATPRLPPGSSQTRQPRPRSLEAQCTTFVHWGRGSLSLVCALSQSGTPQGSGLSQQSDIPLAFGALSLEPLTPYCPPAAEAREAPTTTAVLASHEPGF